MRPYGFKREDCTTCRARSGRFFCDLDAAALRDFEKLGFSNVYPPGSILFTEGQIPQGVFLVCQGNAKLSICAADGRSLISRIAGPGEVLGLSNVITGSAYQSTAETLEVCRVLFVRREDFIRFLPVVSANAVRQLSYESEANLDNIRTLGLSHSAAEKLAGLLMAWCRRDGKPGPDGIRVPFLLTHEDISQIIGTSRETVTRMLGAFRDQGLISIRGAVLIVHDPEAVEEMVLV